MIWNILDRLRNIHRPRSQAWVRWNQWSRQNKRMFWSTVSRIQRKNQSRAKEFLLTHRNVCSWRQRSTLPWSFTATPKIKLFRKLRNPYNRVQRIPKTKICQSIWDTVGPTMISNRAYQLRPETCRQKPICWITRNCRRTVTTNISRAYAIFKNSRKTFYR